MERGQMLWILTLVSVGFTGSQGSGSDITETCQLDTYTAQCADDEVIVMTRANYGRMRLGACVKINYGSLGCASDVLSEMDRRCSGRHKCEFIVSELHGSNPCPGDLTPYLESSYRCEKVIKPAEKACSHSDNTKLTSPQGQLANVITEDSDHGSNQCPWTIQGQPGQRINITLINFARSPDFEKNEVSEDSPVDARPRVCYQFAVIREQTTSRTLTECEGGLREVHAYLSRSETVEISVLSTGSTNSYFLLSYSIIGCPNPIPPKGAWVKREGATLTVKCNQTEETWYMTCKGTTWKGTVGNCTGATSTWVSGQIFGEKGSFPYGLLIVVAIGVALGVFFGGILLTIASIYMKRKQKKKRCRATRDAGF